MCAALCVSRVLNMWTDLGGVGGCLTTTWETYVRNIYPPTLRFRGSVWVEQNRCPASKSMVRVQ